VAAKYLPSPTTVRWRGLEDCPPRMMSLINAGLARQSVPPEHCANPQSGERANLREPVAAVDIRVPLRALHNLAVELRGRLAGE
jgi:hypothetical protein